MFVAPRSVESQRSDTYLYVCWNCGAMLRKQLARTTAVDCGTSETSRRLVNKKLQNRFALKSDFRKYERVDGLHVGEPTIHKHSNPRFAYDKSHNQSPSDLGWLFFKARSYHHDAGYVGIAHES